MKTIFTTLALAFSSLAFSQSEAPGIIWNKDFTSSSDTGSFSAEDILQLSDGNFIVASGISENSNIIAELTKVSDNGNIIWQKKYPNVIKGYPYSTRQDSNGNLYLISEEESTSLDTQFYKLDSSGNFVWKKNISFSGYNNYIDEITILSDNTILLCGSYYTEEDDLDGGNFFTKYDTNGNQIWIKTKQHNGYPASGILQILPTNDGGYLGGGNMMDANEKFSGYIVKYDAQRNIVWEKTIDISPNGDTFFESMIINSNGEIIISGTNENSNANNNLFVIKKDASGNDIWSKSYDLASGNINKMKIIEFSPNEYTLAYSTYNNNGYDDKVLKKINNDGSTAWEHNYNDIISPENNYYGGITKTTDNNLMLLTRKITNGTDPKHSLYKLGGSLAVANFSTSQLSIYPNPTADFINIKTKNNQKISKVEIFDLSGRLIKTEMQNTNSIDVKSLNKGSYLLKVSSNEESVSSKFIKQ